MTPKQRMFNAISRKPVDRFPFCTYNCHPFTWGAHQGAPGYGPILEKIAHTSAGCLCKTSVRTVSQRSEFETDQRMVGDDSYTTVTWHTPKGPLTQVTRKPADQPSMCVKPYITEPDDVEKYLSVAYVPAQWDVSLAVKHAQEIGEKGVAYLDYGDPFYQVSDLFDQEDFAIQLMTEFDFIHSLVEFRFERLYNDLKRLLEALAPFNTSFLFYTVGPERATPPLTSPEIFRRLVVPYQKRFVELIHNYGYPVSLHCHGRVREVFPYILACGFDVLEPIEPPPQGNYDLKDLRKAAEGKIALLGYVQDQDFYLRPEEQIRNHVQAIADLIGQDTGYICCPTCTPFQYPPTDTYVTNYIAFLDEAEAAGISKPIGVAR